MWFMTITNKWDPEVQHMIERAEQCERNGEMEQAEHWYREALKRAKNPGLWGSLAWLLLGRQDFKEALKAAKKMQGLLSGYKSPPLLATASGLIGYIHLEAGRKSLAERYFRDSISLYPRPEIFVLLGALLNDGGKNIQAKVCFQKALEIEPQFSEAHYNLALWYRRHQDFTRTINHLHLALESNPDHAPALTLLASVMWREGGKRFITAKQMLHRALPYSADFPRAPLFLALNYVLLGKVHVAENHFRQAIEHFPTDSTLLWCYGWFLEQVLQQPEEAEAYYQKALEADPRDGLARYYYACFLLARGRRDEARAAFRQARALGIRKANELEKHAAGATESD